MKKALAAAWIGLMIAVLSGGCSTDVCDDAVTKLIDDCGFVGGVNYYPNGPGPGECNASRACFAQCVLSSSCEEFAKSNGAFSKCALDCPQK